MLSQAMLLAQEEAGLAIGGIFMLIWALLGIASFVIWIWALISAIQNPALDSTMRIVWVLVILLTNVIGAIIYLLVGRGGSGATTHGADHY